jgi:hypothetical protein
VTPKGGGTDQHLPLLAVAPYAVLSLVSGLSVIVFADVQSAGGFYFFAILNCAIYAGLVAVIVIRHAVENKIPWRLAPRPALVRHALSCGLLLVPIAGLVVRGPAALEALTWGSEGLRVTTTTYAASGAGQRGDRIRKVRFTLFESNEPLQ